jgi:hypothetical protein
MNKILISNLDFNFVIKKPVEMRGKTLENATNHLWQKQAKKTV